MTRIKAYFHLLPVTDNSPYLIQFKDPKDLLKQLEYDYHVYVTIEETQLVKYNYHFTIDPSIKHQYEHLEKYYLLLELSDESDKLYKEMRIIQRKNKLEN
jgi:hypothetical protein